MAMVGNRAVGSPGVVNKRTSAILPTVNQDTTP
jgi:hypothetical protein